MSTNATVNLVILRQIIGHKFNKSELRDLCFELQINHESLPADTIDDMVRELVTYVDRRDRVRELLDICQQKRPQINWEDEVTTRITDLPHDLRRALESRYVGVRVGCVSELENLLNNSDRNLAIAARSALERLLDDDSRQVSSAAAKVLESFNEASRTQTGISVEAKQAGFDWQEWVGSASEKFPKQESRSRPGGLQESRLAQSITIETLGGVCTPLLPKDTVLPAEVTQTFSTAADGQTQVEIHLLLGESESASDNVSLGKFLLDGIPPAPRGIPQILVRTTVDADLQLSVSATDQATSRTRIIGRIDLTTVPTPLSTNDVADRNVASSTRPEEFDFGDQSGGFSDFFETLFGGQSRSRAARRGSDLQMDLTISFAEAVLGVEKEVAFNRPEVCESCHGSGAKPGSNGRECKNCSGSGEVRTKRPSNLGEFIQVTTCPDCEGSGKLITERCGTCGGSKLVQNRRSLRAKIPAGVADGAKIRLSGQGAKGVSGASDGDLYILVHVAPHQYFTREDQDIILELPITPGQARRGGSIRAPTVDGNVKLTIPADIQHGQTLILRGKGVPNLREPSQKGNQLVKLIVAEPSRLDGRAKLVFDKTNSTFKRKRWLA